MTVASTCPAYLMRPDRMPQKLLYCCTAGSRPIVDERVERVNTQTMCVANIGPRERRKRMKFGMGWLARGGGLLAALALVGAPRWWRLSAFIPFLLGSIGVFQAREHT